MAQIPFAMRGSGQGNSSQEGLCRFVAAQPVSGHGREAGVARAKGGKKE